MTDQNIPTPNNWDFSPDDDGAIAIPVRVQAQVNQTDEKIRRLEQQQRETEDMIHHYEQQYGTVRYEEATDSQQRVAYKEIPVQEKRKNGRADGWFNDLSDSMPPRHRYPVRAPQTGLRQEEKDWAFIAHASSLLTLILLFTGPLALVGLIVPIGIYFFHRNKSQYVAFHALQAFTLQVVCTVGALLLLLTGLIVSVLLMLTIIGIIIGVPLLILTLLVAGAMPFGMVVYGMIAAFASRSGRNYRYAYIADWVDDQVSNGIFGVSL